MKDEGEETVREDRVRWSVRPVLQDDPPREDDPVLRSQHFGEGDGAAADVEDKADDRPAEAVDGGDQPEVLQHVHEDLHDLRVEGDPELWPVGA